MRRTVFVFFWDSLLRPLFIVITTFRISFTGGDGHGPERLTMIKCNIVKLPAASYGALKR